MTDDLDQNTEVQDSGVVEQEQDSDDSHQEQVQEGVDIDKSVEFEEDKEPHKSYTDETSEDVSFENEDDQDDQDDDDNPLEDEVETTLASVIEAILFASDEPLTKARLVKIAEVSSSKPVTEAVKELNRKYRENNSSFRIERIAGGYQMMTLPVYNFWLKKMLKVKTDSKLSQAALETLAVVAYKQPVIRADVEAIRGVASGEIIRSLMYKGLVKIVGRAEVIGRPLLYGTTKKFLEVFGLNTLKDLPSVEELKKPNQQ